MPRHGSSEGGQSPTRWSLVDRLVPATLRERPEAEPARRLIRISLGAGALLLALGLAALAGRAVSLGVAALGLGAVLGSLPLLLRAGARLFLQPLVERAEEASRVARREARRRHRGEARFRSLIEHSEDGISIVDAQLRVRYESPSALRLRGLDPDTPPGQFAVIHPDDHPTLRARLERCFAQPGVLVPFRLRVRHGDGSWRVQEGTGLNLLDDPAVEGLVFNFRDVTDRERIAEEQRRLEQGLRESQRLESLGVMAGGIAHDFNNLLVGIQGNLGLALQDRALSPRLRALLEDAQTASEGAAGLTRQLLAYAGKGSFSREVLDLTELAREAQQLVRGSLPAHARLEVKEPKQHPWVEVDATQIQQVVINLLTNAAEALPASGGHMRLRTGASVVDGRTLQACRLESDLGPGECAFLEVADDGAGMDEATLERIFDPFFTTKATGRGLGLAATRGILARHGASLHVRSRPQQGTLFRILLPLRAPGRLAAISEAPGETTACAGSVLVVDDQAMVRRVVARTLEARGYRVVLAASGEEALRAVEGGASLVGAVIDFFMPGMNGADTLSALRRTRPGLPVLLTSGYSECEAGSLLEQGRVGFLAKPFSPSTLAEAFEELLSS